MSGLREATTGELPGLLDRLATHLPHSFTVHGVVKMRLTYGLETCKYILVAPPPSTLVVTTPMTKVQSLSVFWNIVEEDDAGVAELLASSPLIDWTRPVLFYGCSTLLLHKVDVMMKSGRLGGVSMAAPPFPPTHLYTITRDALLSTSHRLCEGFRIGSILSSHANHLFKHWKYSQTGTLQEYTQVLQALPGYAVYTTHPNLPPNPIGHTLADSTEAGDVTEVDSPKTSDVGDHSSARESAPVAWTHLTRNNTIGNTFTMEKYRRQGLGKAVTLALASQLLQDVDRASVFLDDHNDASIRLHESLGFSKECGIGWHFYTVMESNASHYTP